MAKKLFNSYSLFDHLNNKQIPTRLEDHIIVSKIGNSQINPSYVLCVERESRQHPIFVLYPSWPYLPLHSKNFHKSLLCDRAVKSRVVAMCELLLARGTFCILGTKNVP